MLWMIKPWSHSIACILLALCVFLVHSSGLKAACEDFFRKSEKGLTEFKDQQVIKKNQELLAQTALNSEAKFRRAQFRSLSEARKENFRREVEKLQEDIEFEFKEYLSDMALLDQREVAFTIQMSRENPPGLDAWLKKNKKLLGLREISVNQDALDFKASAENAKNFVDVLLRNYGAKLPEFIQLKASYEFLKIAEEFIQSSLLESGRLEYTREIENVENLLNQFIEKFYRVQHQSFGSSGKTLETGRLPHDFYKLDSFIKKEDEFSEPVQEFLETPFKVMLPIKKEYLLFMLPQNFQRNYEGRLNKSWDADFQKLSKEVNSSLQTELKKMGFKRDELSAQLLRYDHLNDGYFPLSLHGGEYLVEFRGKVREHLRFYERFESSGLDFLFEGYGEAKIDL